MITLNNARVKLVNALNLAHELEFVPMWREEGNDTEIERKTKLDEGNTMLCPTASAAGEGALLNRSNSSMGQDINKYAKLPFL